MAQYFRRNKWWLCALMFAAALSVADVLLALVSASASEQIPSWLRTGALLLAGVVTGIGAMCTVTASAKVVRLIGYAFAVISLVYQFHQRSAPADDELSRSITAFRQAQYANDAASSDRRENTERRPSV